jgi:arginine repressor
MPKIFKPELEVDIKRLSKENYSYTQIKKKLKEEDIDVSVASICRVLNNIGIGRQALNNGEKNPNIEDHLPRELPL